MFIGGRIKALAVLVLLGLPGVAAAAPVPALPELVRQTVVSISTGGKVVGSGYLQSTDKWIYVISAKHVIQPYMGSAVEVTFWAPQDTSAPSTTLIDLPESAVDHSIFFSTADAVALRFGSFWGRGRGIVPANVHPKSNIAGRSVPVIDGAMLVDMAEVAPTEDVVLVGYPSSLNNYMEPENRFYDDTDPLFRRGMVAGKNRQRDFLIIDAAVLPGNSGGPVFVKRARDLFLAGIATDFVPSVSISKNERGVVTNVSVQNAGYTVVLPSDRIRELLLRADAVGN